MGARHTPRFRRQYRPSNHYSGVLQYRRMSRPDPLRTLLGKPPALGFRVSFIPAPRPVMLEYAATFAVLPFPMSVSQTDPVYVVRRNA